MALIKCTDCGEKISKKAKSCPKCGAPVKKKTSLFTWLVTIFIVLVVVSAITTKDNRPPSNEVSAVGQIDKPTPKATDAMQSQREKVQALFQGNEEPTAKDALWTSNTIFKVGVIDDGTPRDGYASYICQVLYEHGFRGKNVWVQVIDIVKLTRNNDWVKLGESHCQ